ncbi:GPI ethanolamine phosphate transferase 1 [Hypsibius exemplaris]|uniref:Guanylate cyclase n=1 Tax=Hypsibius exemplaris TaxID=2072580 RepID=A0A1W0X5J5_HYPEX|nr:GPI ethanolamine phosphate transferase 1 [Hypsibius exemplaris]
MSISWLIICGVLIHVIFLKSIFDIYFTSPLVHGMTNQPINDSAPAKRLVLISCDGLRADKFFENDSDGQPWMPFLRRRALHDGIAGVSQTRVPTESRPGHVAMIAGFYEDVSAVTKGWKENPVEFDSVFNQSRFTWGWGSPDIITIFTKDKKDSGELVDIPHIFADTYSAEFEDFAASPVLLDFWVFDRVTEFLTKAKYNLSAMEMLHQDKIILFLHLLGMDTTGHVFKPQSEVYTDTMRQIDERVATLTEELAQFYQNDGQTAFIFTADHGMTDWGSHGSGQADETATPIVAWGAGITETLGSGLRFDVEQADLAPLMSALIGIPIPANSVGVLPLDYLNASEAYKTAAFLANAKQIYEQVRVTSERRVLQSSSFIPFPSLDSAIWSRMLSELETDRNKFPSATAVTTGIAELIQLSLNALDYYHKYDRYFLQSLVVLGYAGWMVLILIVLVQNAAARAFHARETFSRSLVGGGTTIGIFVIWYLLAHGSPMIHLLYGLLPVFTWTAVISQLQQDQSPAPSYVRKASSIALLFCTAVLCITGVELLVLSFFHRSAISVGLVLGGVWIFFTSSARLSIKGSWLLTSLLLSVFPVLPVVGKSRQPALVILSGAVGICALVVLVWKRQKTASASANLLKVQAGLLTAAVAIVFVTAQSVDARVSPGLVVHACSWTLLGLSFLLPFFGSTELLLRFANVAVSLLTSYLLMSVAYEGLFFLVFTIHLYLWVTLEHQDSTSKLPLHSMTIFDKFSHGLFADTRPFSLTDLRRAFFFVFFILTAFFGTGNIASINSFDPASAFSFVTVFRPFIMAAILLCKVMVPFLLVGCAFHILQAACRVPMQSMCLVVMLISDCMALNFFFLQSDVKMKLFSAVLFWMGIKELGSSKTNILKVTVKSGGATLPANVYKVWNAVYRAYRSDYSDVDIVFQGVGVADGVRRFATREYSFAALNDDLSDEQYANNSDWQLFPTFALPVSLAYNVPELAEESSNAGSGIWNTGNLNLTRENIVGIFNGTIKYWNDSQLVDNNVALADVTKKIIIGAAIGGTSIFTKALTAFSSEWSRTYGSFSDGCSKSEIAKRWRASLNIQCVYKNMGLQFFILNTKYSIGFIGSADARDAELPDARILNQDNNWVRPSVQTTQAAMDNVSTNLGLRLTGPLINAPGPFSYPIAGYTYVLIRKTTMTNCTVAMELYRMFAFLLESSVARSIVSDLINAPLSGVVWRQVKDHALDEMMCQGFRVKDLVAVATSIEDGSYDAWKLPVTIVCVLIGAALLMLLAFFLYIKYTQNRSALRNTFIIPLNVIETVTKSAGSLPTMSVTSSNPSKTQTHDTMEWTTGAGAGVVKANTMQWSTKVMLVRLKDKLSHGNLLRMVGVAYHDAKWKLITACPTKGRLQDILHAGKYNLDNIFRHSILNDIADGMAYLHKNGLVHGQLTSNSCYIDARWNVVVGDWEQFALHQAQKIQFVAFENLYAEANAEIERDIANYAEYLKCLFWTAPEALTKDHNDIFIASRPGKPADVYSYGIITFEVLTDLLPYENTVEHDAFGRPLLLLVLIKMDHLRPTIPIETLMNSGHISALVKATWKSEANERPTFTDILRLMRTANPKHRNIIDSMMQAVENYAASLEEKVAERTRELERLTKNMESLLHSMLPPSIADRLAKGLTVEPEFYESSTLFFSDIVGFTSIASASAPLDIVTLLNDLYSAFDGVIRGFDVYKVETIGDAYMCISGLPHRNGDDHANQIATMALDMLFTVTTIPIRHMPERKLQIRIGAHTGAVMAGVVGITMPRYCLFGDTVNTASRMESSSLPMRIQISDDTRSLLAKLNVYSMVFRGDSIIKGKGAMKTYWLVGKEGYVNPLPAFDSGKDEELLLLLDETQVK